MLLESDTNKKRKVILAVTNCICYDQRVRKMALLLQKMGCDVTVAGRYRGSCCQSEELPFVTSRFKMLFRKGFLFYKWYNIRLFAFLLVKPVDLIVSNDLDTLLACYLASRIRSVPLVYDSHEYFTGVPELQNRPFVRAIWKAIEKSIFPRLRYVITVSESIADLYYYEYKVRPVVIRNMPVNYENILPFSRTELGVDEDDLLVIYQGTGINTGRGGEELIEAIKMTERVSLLVVGTGDVIDKLKTKSEVLNLGSKVKFFPPVAKDILLKYTLMADAGLSLDKDTNLNYRFSLPNKVFDYISAGIPVISSNLPEIANIIKNYQCGILIDSVTPSEISAAFQLLTTDKTLAGQLRQNSSKASQELNWEKESKKVVELYNKVFSEC